MINNRYDLFASYDPDSGFIADHFLNDLVTSMGETHYSFIPNLPAGREWDGDISGFYMRADRIAWDDLTLTFPNLTAEERAGKGPMKWVDRRFRALARPMAILDHICMTGEQPRGMWRINMIEDLGMAAALLKPELGPMLSEFAIWQKPSKPSAIDLMEEYMAALNARCIATMDRAKQAQEAEFSL